MTYKHTLQRAFSLVELSIVLAISGIMISGGLLVATITLENTALTDTAERLDEVNDALKSFLQTQGRLPCPSPLNAAPGAAGYGTESLTSTGDCAPFALGIWEVGSGDVAVGGVPSRTLGIPDKMMADAYGSRFIYAVTETLTDATQFTDIDASDADSDGNTLEDLYQGVIRVNDRSDAAIVSNAAYVLLSVGPDKKGGFAHKTGSVPIACSGAQLDQENCDISGDNVFRDARFNPDSPNDARYFDDMVRYAPKYVLAQSTAGGAENLCSENNINLSRYDDARERFQRCVASGTSYVWDDVAVLGIVSTAPECTYAERNLVRAAASPVAPGNPKLEYCNFTAPATAVTATGLWTGVTGSE